MSDKTTALAEILFNAFQGRRDVVPEYYKTKSGKKGYSPICTNRFKINVCALKSGGNCSKCENAKYQELTVSLLTKHIKGDTILGVYPMLPGDNCNFIACDIDDHEGNKGTGPLADVLAVHAVMDDLSLPHYIFRSKSGNGFHIYMMFAEPVPAITARRVFRYCIETSGIAAVPDSSFDRFIPNQDELSKKGFGNLIALPWQGQASKGGHTLMLDQDTGFIESFAKQSQAMQGIVKVELSHLDAIVAEFKLDQGHRNGEQQRKDGDYSPTKAQNIIDRCGFIKHCRDEAATLPEPQWYNMISVLCRCIDGDETIHELSGAYPGYSKAETDRKINQAKESSGPVTCHTIKTQTMGVWCHGCQEVCKSPVSLGMAVSKSMAPMEEMNQRYGCIMIGGKFRVIEEGYNWSLNRKEYRFLTRGDFAAAFQHRKIWIEVGDKKVRKQLGEAWLDWEDRRQYSDMVFDPTMKAPADVLNTYQGFAVEPKPGDWSLMRDHILQVICSGNEEYAKYIICWMAHIVQHPGGPKPGVAIVLKGERGTGKGSFVNAFGQILGCHFLPVSDSKRLSGRFNAVMESTILMFVDEAFWGGNKQDEGILKALITEDLIQVERKGIEPVVAKNHLNLIMATNNEWAVPVGMKERRFFCLEVSECRIQDHDYFGRLSQQMDNGGVGAMLYDLLRIDLSQVNIRKVPKTEEMMTQMLHGMTPQEQYWHYILDRGYLLNPQLEQQGISVINHETKFDWEYEISTEIFHAQYLQFCSERKLWHPGSIDSLGRALRRLCRSVQRKRRTDGARERYYLFPSWDKCKEMFQGAAGASSCIWGACDL